MAKRKINRLNRKIAAKVSMNIWGMITWVIQPSAYGLVSRFSDELGDGLTDREVELVRKHVGNLRDEAEFFRKLGRHLGGR